MLALGEIRTLRGWLLRSSRVCSICSAVCLPNGTGLWSAHRWVTISQDFELRSCSHYGRPPKPRVKALCTGSERWRLKGGCSLRHETISAVAGRLTQAVERTETAKSAVPPLTAISVGRGTAA